ncbi:MAG: 23S rRNA (uracil(1939)-C(5))-methyltransferase RlmD [Coprothermobacterota bacterium]|nr:23S rRNA (uracil(1939)-C(5))-methyltransferase RlmD [Coprothermobacterota bacterium]
MQKGEALRLEIEKLIYEGKALARAPDGRVVFLEGALPGESVLAQVTKVKSDYLRARLLEIITPSSSRVSPKCGHFLECGGCSLQHASYELQLESKREFVADSFKRIGGIKSIEVKDCLPSPMVWRYRNKMEFTFQAGEGVNLGLHPRGDFRRVVDLKECPISSFSVEEIFPIIRDWASDFGLSVWDLREHKGALRHLVIRRSQRREELLLNLICGEEIPELAKEALVSRLKEATIIFTLNRSWGDSHHVDKEEVLSGSGFIVEEIGELRFRISPSSFFQTNSLQAEALYQKIREFARDIHPERILDLYCGTGTIACFLADTAPEVWGVEKMAQAVSDAKINASLNGLDNLHFLQKEAEEMDNLSQFDLIILDPPRSGLHPKTREILNLSRATYIIYVSCNPTTLARDLQELTNYELLEALPFDFFPHTFHVETCAILKLSG